MNFPVTRKGNHPKKRKKKNIKFRLFLKELILFMDEPIKNWWFCRRSFSVLLRTVMVCEKIGS